MVSWTQVADLAAAVCILLGAVLALIAAIGVVRLPDLLTRMHAATKPQVLQMATSVVSSHMVGRASFRAGQVRHDLLVVDELSDRPSHEEPRGAP